MNNKRLKEGLKSILIVLLAVSAIVLFMNISSFGTLIDRLRGEESADGLVSGVSDDTGANLPLKLAYMSVAGRCALSYDSGDIETSLVAIAAAVSEALGSASNVKTISESVWQLRLQQNGLYLDYWGEIPAGVFAGWLSVELPEDFPEVSLRRLLLAEAGEDTKLCFSSGDTFYECDTAVKFAAVESALEWLLPNGASFAFELDGNYKNIAPYTLLQGAAPELPPLSVSSPLGTEQAQDKLITALEFNPNSTARYEEGSGTQVIIETMGTLRFSPGGGVVYNGTASGGRITIPSDGAAGVSEVVAFARQLSRDCGLLDSGEQSLYLACVEETAGTIKCGFEYLVNGAPVILEGERSAMVVEVSAGVLTYFELNMRVFESGEGTVTLLPERMAVAAIGDASGGEIYVAYAPGGEEGYGPLWLAAQ